MSGFGGATLAAPINSRRFYSNLGSVRRDRKVSLRRVKYVLPQFLREFGCMVDIELVYLKSQNGFYSQLKPARHWWHFFVRMSYSNAQHYLEQLRDSVSSLESLNICAQKAIDVLSDGDYRTAYAHVYEIVSTLEAKPFLFRDYFSSKTIRYSLARQARRLLDYHD